LTNALSHFSQEWATKYGPIFNFPPSFYTNRTNLYFGTSGWSILGEVQANTYSLGMAPLPFIYFAGWSGFALMR
jgi:hypothetical protein